MSATNDSNMNRTEKLLNNKNVKEIIRYSQKYNKLYKSFPIYSVPLPTL